MQTGEAIETGIIGAEGLLEGDAPINGHLSTHATVQLEGAALKMPKAQFVDAYHAHPGLREFVNRTSMDPACCREWASTETVFRRTPSMCERNSPRSPQQALFDQFPRALRLTGTAYNRSPMYLTRTALFVN